MHHIDVTPSAADVARPLAPSDVTVALETGAGCLRAYHRRPGRPGDLGYPVAPTVTALSTPPQTPCRWPSAGRPPLLDRPGPKRRPPLARRGSPRHSRPL